MSLTTVPQYSCQIPPQFQFYPHATPCGAEFFPEHIANLNSSAKSYSFKKVQELEREIDQIATEIGKNPLFKQKDATHAQFVAAMGGNWRQDTEWVKRLPQLGQATIKEVRVDNSSAAFLTVDPNDMTSPVMRGTFKNDRPFFAVKVVDVKTGEIFSQLFHKKCHSSDWTTLKGVVVAQTGQEINHEDFYALAHLFNGQAVLRGEGKTVRLACEYDQPVVDVSPDVMIDKLQESARPWYKRIVNFFIKLIPGLRRM